MQVLGIPLWPDLGFRGVFFVLGLLLVGTGVRGLRGKPLLVPRSQSPIMGAREVAGWEARVFGLLALLFAAVFLSIALDL